MVIEDTDIVVMPQEEFVCPTKPCSRRQKSGAAEGCRSRSCDSLAKAAGEEGDMDNWIFVALLGAAAVHIFEEYVYPGGFPDALRKLLPRGGHLFTPKFHLAVNGLFLLLCLSSVSIGKSNLILSLSTFSLVFANAVLHIRGAIVMKRYYPGVISGALIYIPLAVYAYSVFLSSRQLTWLQAGFSFLLGVLCMGVLMAYVLIQRGSNTGQQGPGEIRDIVIKNRAIDRK